MASTLWNDAWERAQPSLGVIRENINARSPDPRIVRVGQLDSELLDQELVQLLQDPISKALGLISVSLYIQMISSNHTKWSCRLVWNPGLSPSSHWLYSSCYTNSRYGTLDLVMALNFKICATLFHLGHLRLRSLVRLTPIISCVCRLRTSKSIWTTSENFDYTWCTNNTHPILPLSYTNARSFELVAGCTVVRSKKKSMGSADYAWEFIHPRGVAEFCGIFVEWEVWDSNSYLSALAHVP